MIFNVIRINKIIIKLIVIIIIIFWKIQEYKYKYKKKIIKNNKIVKKKIEYSLKSIITYNKILKKYKKILYILMHNKAKITKITNKN